MRNHKNTPGPFFFLFVLVTGAWALVQSEEVSAFDKMMVPIEEEPTLNNSQIRIFVDTRFPTKEPSIVGGELVAEKDSFTGPDLEKAGRWYRVE